MTRKKKLPKEQNGQQIAESKRQFRYIRLLPHEMTVLIPHIERFYSDIGFKEAIADPKPAINAMQTQLMSNPYSFLYACIDEKNEPMGYIWFQVQQNLWNEWHLSIEHDYVIPELRDKYSGAKIHKVFIEYMMEIYNRCGCAYSDTEVPNSKLHDSRKKLGFKAETIKMTYRGTAQDFIKLNPMFGNRGQENEQAK